MLLKVIPYGKEQVTNLMFEAAGLQIRLNRIKRYSLREITSYKYLTLCY